MKPATLTLPDGSTLNYQIRSSNRAKYIRMEYSPDKGLVVTQPRGVCEHRLADWVNGKVDWINNAVIKTAEKQQHRAPDKPLERPDTIELPAINEVIQVKYIPTRSTQISASEDDNGLLTLQGAVDNTGFCIHVLQKWTQSYAKYHLGVLLHKAAEDTGFTFNSYRVKAQKSRWGSCSTRGNINLNYKLLLMPPEWARYTMIHELCHTQEMNHSKRFWALVEQQMPDYKRVHEAMKRADTVLPAWVNYQF